MRRTIPLLILPLLLAACDAMPSGSRPDEDEMLATEEFSVPGQEVLWVITIRELEKIGFELDGMKSDPAEGVFESRWVRQLAPHRYQGTRRKIVGRIVPSEERPGRYRVRATTWTQTNADMDDPLDPARAIWQDTDPDDPVTEEFFFRIRSHF